MSTLRNHVKLIGKIGQHPTISNLESGKKVAKFSLATNEFYKNFQAEKVQETQWHNIIAWGKTAEIIEKFSGKGKEIGVSGKLKSQSYEDKNGITHTSQKGKPKKFFYSELQGEKFSRLKK